MGIFSWLFRRKGKDSDRGKERMGWSEEPDYQEEFLKDDPKDVANKKSASPATSAKKQEEFIDFEFDSDFFLANDESVVKETAPAPTVKTNAAKKEGTTKKPVSSVDEVTATPAQAKKPAAEVKKVNTEVKKAKPEAKKPITEEKKSEPKAKKPEDAVKEPKNNVKSASKVKQNPTTKSQEVKQPEEKEIEDDSPEVKDAVAVGESKATKSGKFDIRRAKDGRYFFSLYASNHAVIAYSQIYSSTKSVTTGINSVIANAPKAPIEDNTLKNPTSLSCPKWEIYIDKADQYRFRLYAANGLCVCHASHGYATKSGAKGGIESIKRFSAEARIDKSYLAK